MIFWTNVLNEILLKRASASELLLHQFLQATESKKHMVELSQRFSETVKKRYREMKKKMVNPDYQRLQNTIMAQTTSSRVEMAGRTTADHRMSGLKTRVARSQP